MRTIATFLMLVPLLATSAYARPHCRHCSRQRSVRAAPYADGSVYYGAAPRRDMSDGYMPSAGEISGNTGGYAHPEGSGSIP